MLEYPDQEPDSDPRQAHLMVEAAIEPDAASESVQPSIANTNATLGYSLATHGWNDPAGAPEPSSGLDWAREHFWMDTFVGHLLSATYVTGGFAFRSPGCLSAYS